MVNDPVESDMETDVSTNENPDCGQGDDFQDQEKPVPVSNENNVMLSKNGQERWSKVPLPENQHVRPRPYNIIRERPGPTQAAKNIYELGAAIMHSKYLGPIMLWKR